MQRENVTLRVQKNSLGTRLVLVYHVKVSVTLLVGEGWSSLIDKSQCLKVLKWLTVASVEWVVVC